MADLVLANPSVNVYHFSSPPRRGDQRFFFGDPRVGNANYAYIQHFIYHFWPIGVDR